MCLEEMLHVSVQQGYLFYWEIRAREAVVLDTPLRDKTCQVAEQMRQIYDQRQLPPPDRPKSRCKNCSLYDDCMPAAKRVKKVALYIDHAFPASDE
jgi:CRISPR-associated exonuclease Cas4